MTHRYDSDHPLSTDEIGAALDERLDIELDPSLAERRISNRLAEALAMLDREQQEFVLRWVSIIAQTHAEMAYQFAAHAPTGLSLMSQSDIEGWIMRAMDVFDRMGLFPAIAVFREAARYAQEARANASGLGFDDVSGVLELFVRGLSGRGVKLEPGDDTYTDTTILFLPQRVSRFPERERNFALYKAMAAHLWAQTWFGTFRVDLTQALAHYSDVHKATRLFHALETVRLDACLARELPGLHRDLMGLKEALNDSGYPTTWALHLATLQQPSATADTTLAIVQQLYATEVPPPLCYQGGLFPDRADAAIALRLAREKDQFRTALARLVEEKDKKENNDEQAEDEAENAETEGSGKTLRPQTRTRPGAPGQLHLRNGTRRPARSTTGGCHQPHGLHHPGPGRDPG